MESRGLQLLTQAVEQQPMPHALDHARDSPYENQGEISNHQTHHKVNHTFGTTPSTYHQMLIPDINNGTIGNITNANVIQDGHQAHRVSPHLASQQQFNNADVTPVGMTDPKRGGGAVNELQKTREHIRQEKDSFDNARRMEFAQQYQQQHSQLGYGGAPEYQHAGYWNAPITSGTPVYQYATAGEQQSVSAQRHGFAGTIRPGQGDLGILNAETFDDGGEAVRAQEEMQRRLRMNKGKTTRESTWGYVTEDIPAIGAPVSWQGRGEDAKSPNKSAQNQQSSPTRNSGRTREASTEDLLPEASKKRKRKAKALISPNPDEEDEASKKSRGRPRVDPNDETPAERRRTQIRLAQRAYRNRKESTISSLEDTVKQLKESSQEVNSLFLKLFDLASSNDLLTRQPDLAARIEAVSQRIKSTEDALPEDLDDEARIVVKYRESSDGIEADLTPPQSEHDSRFEMVAQPTHVREVILLNKSQGQATQNMQVISRPTVENASFPFETVELHNYQNFELDLFAQTINLQANPPLPASGAHYEISFARRLQRRTAECALDLALKDSPHPGKWNRVFGITSQYETKPQIVARLHKVVGATRDMTLSIWNNQPLIHHGGSGTHYPRRERDTSTTPKTRSEHGMGPFSRRVAKFQDKVLQDSLTLENLTHLRATFFDADDVEGYLTDTLGITINPSQDISSIELDLVKLFETMNQEGRRSAQNGTSVSATPPQANHTSTLNNLFATEYPHNTFNARIPGPVPGEMFANPSPVSVSPQSMSSINSASNDITSGQSMTSDDRNDINKNGDFNTKTTVLIDVEKFIRALVAACTCLGRAPGYKPADVNQALMDSMEFDPRT